jgi:hypothetical protein
MRCLVLASVLFAACLVDASDRHCLGPGDIDASHVVDLNDHSLFADCITGPDKDQGIGCPLELRASADIDVDGDVDLADVALFAQKFSNSYFDYGPYRENKEAEHLALKLTGALRAPDFEYERIHRDLALLGEAFPELAGIGDFPQTSNDFVVRLFSNENRAKFDLLNDFYLITQDQEYDFSPDLHVISFCDIINPVALGFIYTASSEVDYAGAGAVGCPLACCTSRIDIESESELFHYDMSFHYGEPPQGQICGCWRRRILQTNETGEVVQVFCEDECLPQCP